jgi:UDP-glucose 4-epimerase
MSDIIIHGASSFLGRHLAKKLISMNTPFTIIARSSSDLEYCSNNSSVTIRRYKKSIDEIVELTASGEKVIFLEFSWHGVFGSERNDPAQLTVNIPLFISSVTAAKRFNAWHWIGVGSQAEYGNLNKKISEDEKCNPTTLYGKSKLLCSSLTAELCNAYGIDHSWLRLFSVYGPDDNHEWLIQYLIREMMSNKEINVTKGEQFWDYLYIDDITGMFLKLIEAKGVGIANLGSGKAVQVKDIIEKIKNITQSSSVINYGAIPYRDDQVMFMEADIDKLSKHLNWIPSIGIEKGLKNTIAFLSEVKHH